MMWKKGCKIATGLVTWFVPLKTKSYEYDKSLATKNTECAPPPPPPPIVQIMAIGPFFDFHGCDLSALDKLGGRFGRFGWEGWLGLSMVSLWQHSKVQVICIGGSSASSFK